MSFMRDTKPFAPLTAGLLARKGQARPAMRPGGAQAGGHDDLGWNDFSGAEGRDGFDRMAQVAEERGQELPSSPSIDQPEPHIRPAATVNRTDVDGGAKTVAPSADRARQGKTKAAFTLRLDADRHLRLRLACAVSHRSAQQIVTEALDAMLAARPDLDAIAGTLPASRAKRTK
jgi:hypothetical protein